MNYTICLTNYRTHIRNIAKIIYHSGIMVLTNNLFRHMIGVFIINLTQ